MKTFCIIISSFHPIFDSSVIVGVDNSVNNRILCHGVMVVSKGGLPQFFRSRIQVIQSFTFIMYLNLIISTREGFGLLTRACNLFSFFKIRNRGNVYSFLEFSIDNRD